MVDLLGEFTRDPRGIPEASRCNLRNSHRRGMCREMLALLESPVGDQSKACLAAVQTGRVHSWWL